MLRPRPPERGNILFLILLAVVLFAALSYAVTSFMQGGGNNANTENADTAAAEILQWFASIDTAVARMHLNGMPYEDMSFGYDGVLMDGTASLNTFANSRCSADTCRIFKTDGGGVHPPDFIRYLTVSPTGWPSSHLRSGLYGAVIQWPGAGTNLNDVMLFLEGVKPDICSAVKRRLGIATMPTISGTFIDAKTPANWDGAGYVLTADYSTMYGNDTFTTGSMSGDGSNGRSCIIRHLVIRR